jgi:UDP-N-acetyl-D-mannosaminuronic acid transferase (WecB/TagA/CpsF family)
VDLVEASPSGSPGQPAHRPAAFAHAPVGVPMLMGVGGSFDVLAGFVPRAPRLVQSLGLEWSWRLAMEPRKLWKRYFVTNSVYLWLAAGEILKRRIGLAGRAGL